MSTNTTPPFLDKPFIVLLVLAGIVVLAGLFVDMHAKFPWEDTPGFFGVFSFISCGILALIAGFVLRPLVKRRADYYGETDTSTAADDRS